MSQFHSIVLTEDDVPGAKLPHQEVEANSVIQLQRWLQCRGVRSTGLKPELVQRVKQCITLDLTSIDVSIDGGKWFELRNQTLLKQNEEAFSKVPTPSDDAWQVFSSTKVPGSFNYGHAHHYFIETVSKLETGFDDSDQEASTADFHTAKPLTRGEVFYKSGHVRDIQNASLEKFFFVRANIQASFRATIYKTSFVLSNESGYIVTGACDCKASAMGRCSHVAALVYAVLNPEESTNTACTSQPCKWNRGKVTTKNPKPVHQATYKCYKKKKSNVIDFDPRPSSLQGLPTQQETNKFILELQGTGRHITMWETILTVKYEDYDLHRVEWDTLKKKCQLLLENLKVPTNQNNYPTELCKSQATQSWYLERRVRITASDAKQVSTMSSTSAVQKYIYSKLWGSLTDTLRTNGILYGSANEANAFSDFIKVTGNAYKVITTGFWVNPQFPELGCSPDGLIFDPIRGANCHGLLEIKCPYILKEIEPCNFALKLSKRQLASFCLEWSKGRIQLKRNHKYYYQVQMQMGVTGLMWTYFVVWSEKGLFYEEIQFDTTLWKYLMKKLVDFHHKFICSEFFEMKLPRDLPLVTLQ